MSVDVCPCEKTEKEGSPGLIELDEQILWVVLNPENSRAKKFGVTKFTKKKLKSSSLSVVRKQHSSAVQIQEKVITPRTALDEEGNPKQEYDGIVWAVAGDIRGITDHNTNERLICIFDSPIVGFESHAMMRYSDATKRDGYWAEKKNDAAAVAGNLHLAFTKNGGPFSLDDCFQDQSDDEPTNDP